MSVFSYHLVKLPLMVAIKGMFSIPISKRTKGLIHSEYMNLMTLGSPIFSPSRFIMSEVAIFAQWENEMVLEEYLLNDTYGKMLAKGWHVRLAFMRQWGKFESFNIPEQYIEQVKTTSPVVAVTLARMKPLEVPRFINWGRPVEKLVRDHPGATLALASFSFPTTVSTFSIWESEKEMTDMVHGHGSIPSPERHSDAMEERKRKDFHFEFTTLRFKPIKEFGSWKGQKNYIPGL